CSAWDSSLSTRLC
nr:immunoglobulin light chain junction region [Macaca mulatta]